MSVLTKVIGLGILGVSALFATDFTVDTSHTNVGFKVKHMMISNVNGKFTDFTGVYTLDDTTKQLTALEGSVKVASITTENEDRDTHLKSDAFFDVKKYPRITLKLIEQKGNKALVKLSIKDVSKVVEMQVEDISGMVKDPWGNIRSAFVLKGTIDRQSFHITFNKVLETGGVMVGNEIKIIIEAEGIKNK